jgi:2-dehydropantoate 2-reductase
MIAECAAILTQHGYAPGEAMLGRCKGAFTAAGSMLTASMFRDLEQGARIEAEPILGDLLGKAEGLETPVLRMATTVVRSYEVRRMREAAVHAHP